LLGMVDGIDQLLARCAGSDPGPHDLAVEVMELAHVFRTLLQTVPADCPYFQVEPERWFDRGGMNIGLVWKSGIWDHHRSLRCSLLQPLGEIEDVTLHILQQGVGLQERPPWFGIDSGSDDILELAKTMVGLDLVISVDSMPVHLAGALGVPTWTLLQADCDWRWMTGRTDSPWYPTMRLFRQERAGDWRPVVERVIQELKRIAKEKHRPTGLVAAAA
jgi:hypothetical protein